MRVTKDPEERRQEIMKAAMQVFCEKGYDKTSISDIAVKLGIAQGLCYRYFRSKEELLAAAIDDYASEQVAEMKKALEQKDKTIEELILGGPNFREIELEDSSYYNGFHGKNSGMIHNQLSLRISQKMQPLITQILVRENAAGRIEVDDPETMASFIVYGQLGILLNQELEPKEKVERIRSFLIDFWQKYQR